MTGTIPGPAAQRPRAASRRCAAKVYACLVTVVTTACFVGAASDTTGPSGALGFRPPPQPPPPPTNPATPPPTESDTVLVTPNISKPGYAIAPNFQGLSLEIWDAINNPRLADPALEQFLVNLGPGVLRIGGITADEHWWNPTTRVARTDGAPVIIDADFTTLFAFSRATNWPVIYTVNLANVQPDTAAAEVQALAAAGGKSLLGVSIGNEPDQYVSDGFRSSSWNWTQMQSQWTSYADAIQARTPGVKFVGLDGCCATALGWLPAFVSSQASRLAIGSHHIYPEWNGAQSGTNYYPSITNLLDSLTTNRVTSDVVELYQALGGQVPLRITESNSVAAGGAPGVSNVFAASLWGVEHMFTLAENGATGVNFHGSLSGGTYQPIDGTPGNYTARPLYYAMLAFHTAAQGQTIPVAVTTRWNVSVHGTVASDGTLRITAINRDPSTAVQIRVTPGRTYTHAGTLRLTAPSLTASSGITFAGSGVSSAGVWKPGTQEAVYTQNGVYAISLPAASAALLTLQP
jgi:Glycosyl hydrolase family 79 C-terminal beta domain